MFQVLGLGPVALLRNTPETRKQGCACESAHMHRRLRLKGFSGIFGGSGFRGFRISS